MSRRGRRTYRVKLEKVRCPTHKTRYLTEAIAAAWMTVVESRDPRSGAGTYWCRHCGGWHWGHKGFAPITPEEDPAHGSP